MLSDCRTIQPGGLQGTDHFLPGMHGAKDTVSRNPLQGSTVTEFRSNYGMTIGERLKQARLALKPPMDVPDLARRVGLAPSTLYDLESGRSNASSKLHRIATALNVSASWLETGNGIMEIREPGGDWNPNEYVDRVSGGKLSAGSGEVIWDFDEIAKSHSFRREWMVERGLHSERCKVWDVKGDSMWPEFKHNDTVLINMADRTAAHGKPFALIGEDGLRIKRLMRKTDGSWEMRSDNPQQHIYPPEPFFSDSMAIIGRVVWKAGNID